MRLFKLAYDVIEKMRRASATHTEQRAELALKKLTIVDDHEYIAHARFRITLKPFILCLYLYTISKDIFKDYMLYFIYIGNKTSY